jgi:hypothetical protein
VKTLFLDIDGVLHPASQGDRVDPYAPVSDAIGKPALFCYAPLLANILPRHDVAVIVHSSWRRFTCEEDLRAMLGPLSRYFAGTTPGATRYEGIRWLVQQNKLTNYRILDDEPSEFPQELRELILCDPERGIDDARVLAQLEAWLND